MRDRPSSAAVASVGGRRFERGLVALIIGLWVLALLLPALGPRGGTALTGFEILTRGWTAWRFGILAWFANPALAIAVVALIWRAPRTALLFSVLAVLLAASSFWTAPLAERAGRSIPELSFASGFYVWMAAHLSALIGGFRLIVRRIGW